MGDLILVVDIGGGTTDFTLIAVTESAGELSLNRVAVGEHILLGGDNIDLALAGVVARRLAEKGTRLDSGQLQALWNNCRMAKEKLLDPASNDKDQPVTILGNGTGLVGGTIKAKLLRSDIEQVLGDGFLPAVAQQRYAGRATPHGPAGTGPAVRRRRGHHTPHGALPAAAGGLRRARRRCAAARAALACPTHVLFNGGVLNAGLVRERILGVARRLAGRRGLPAGPAA